MNIPTSTTLAFDEAIESLTGHDENDVEARFNVSVYDLMEQNATKAGRALAFILVARDLKAAEVVDPQGKAYQHVMGMTLKQIGEFFPDATNEPMPEDPVTEPGKEDFADF